MSSTEDALQEIETSNSVLAEAKRALKRARHERNAAIAHAHKVGVRQTALAERLGVSQSRIHQLITSAQESAAS